MVILLICERQMLREKEREGGRMRVFVCVCARVQQYHKYLNFLFYFFLKVAASAFFHFLSHYNMSVKFNMFIEPYLPSTKNGFCPFHRCYG